MAGSAGVGVAGRAGLVVQVGPRSAEQVGYDLVWQAGQGRAEDWQPRPGLAPGVALALAAEQPGTGRWVGYDEEEAAGW